MYKLITSVFNLVGILHPCIRDKICQERINDNFERSFKLNARLRKSNHACDYVPSDNICVDFGNNAFIFGKADIVNNEVIILKKIKGKGERNITKEYYYILQLFMHIYKLDTAILRQVDKDSYDSQNRMEYINTPQDNDLIVKYDEKTIQYLKEKTKKIIDLRNKLL